MLFFYTFFWDDFERSGGHYKSQCQSCSKFSPSPACLLLRFSPSIAPHPYPPGTPNPRAATSGFTLQNSKGRRSLALSEWCSWCCSVHNLCSRTKQSYPDCIHSSHLLPWATLRPVLDLTRFHSRSSSQILMGPQPPKSSSAAQM